MKNRVIVFLLLLSPFFLVAQSPDTIIRKVYVSFSSSKEIFPIDWRNDPIDATAKPIERREIRHSKLIIAKALNKYPESIFKKNLKFVYFLKEMSFYNTGYGGTNSQDAVYLTNRGKYWGYTDQYVEQTFHHEFSSILFRNNPSLLDTNLWKDANVPGFIYNDPKNGVGVIRDGKASQRLDTALCQIGFLTQYSESSLENDVNTFAQNLFCPEKNFWNYADRYPGIKQKTELLIKFYAALSPMYTEAYFRKLDKQ